jgi:hypothetical protein
MSSIGDEVQETRAQAYARALEAWGQWLRHWRRTGAPRALHTTLICKEIAAERFAAWRAELRAERSARQSIRIARTERDLEQMLVHAKRDEQAILATRGLTDLADALTDDGGRAHSIGRGQGREADLSEPPTARAGGSGACDQP